MLLLALLVGICVASCRSYTRTVRCEALGGLYVGDSCYLKASLKEIEL